uniref:Uncharacterized protein n=1 Tax=Anguilla anguilla TaxID=7936 RepID=A0A0E9WZ46_ANGAN
MALHCHCTVLVVNTFVTVTAMDQTVSQHKRSSPFMRHITWLRMIGPGMSDVAQWTNQR